MNFRLGWGLVSILVLAGSVQPAAAGDVAHGKVVVKRWCASCHVVSSDQTSANADAPSFADVARRHPDKKQLSNFLADPHPPMPNMQLTRREIDDIVSYIRSLDPRPSSPENEGRDPERPKNG
jgi:mono/diheme cytochrome c family protein